MGEIIPNTGIAPVVMATVHPAAILRTPDDATRREEMARFIADLKSVASVTHRLRAA